jgi:hypothetical protein
LVVQIVVVLNDVGDPGLQYPWEIGEDIVHTLVVSHRGGIGTIPVQSALHIHGCPLFAQSSQDSVPSLIQFPQLAGGV